MDRVEIHTPRAESDDVAAYLALKAQALKSTLPVRRVTASSCCLFRMEVLKSTLPVRRVTGGLHKIVSPVAMLKSTLPVRRVTARYCLCLHTFSTYSRNQPG